MKTVANYRAQRKVSDAKADYRQFIKNAKASGSTEEEAKRKWNEKASEAYYANQPQSSLF